MSKRSMVAAILDRAGVFSALLAARSRLPGSSSVPVLVYHCVAKASKDYPFDDGVVDASPAQLDEQMEVVARYFTPVGIDDLVANQHGTPLPHNALVVSFDDGYKNNRDAALPILKRRGVRAVFFVSTRYIDQRRMFWWDRISYLLKASKRPSVSLSYPFPLELDLSGPRKPSIRRALSIVKDHYLLDLDRFLDELAVAADVVWDEATDERFAEQMIMTWEDVRALRAAGMDVESHTHSHRVLQTLTPEAAREELRTSRQVLEEQLGTPVRAISYPCGRSIEESPAITAEVHDAGYALGFSARGGVSSIEDRRSKPLHLLRVPLDATVTLPLFRGMLAFPNLARKL